MGSDHGYTDACGGDQFQPSSDDEAFIDKFITSPEFLAFNCGETGSTPASAAPTTPHGAELNTPPLVMHSPSIPPHFHSNLSPTSQLSLPFDLSDNFSPTYHDPACSPTSCVTDSANLTIGSTNNAYTGVIDTRTSGIGNEPPQGTGGSVARRTTAGGFIWEDEGYTLFNEFLNQHSPEQLSNLWQRAGLNTPFPVFPSSPVGGGQSTSPSVTRPPPGGQRVIPSFPPPTYASSFHPLQGSNPHTVSDNLSYQAPVHLSSPSSVDCGRNPMSLTSRGGNNFQSHRSTTCQRPLISRCGNPVSHLAPINFPSQSSVSIGGNPVPHTSRGIISVPLPHPTTSQFPLVSSGGKFIPHLSKTVNNNQLPRPTPNYFPPMVGSGRNPMRLTSRGGNNVRLPHPTTSQLSSSSSASHTATSSANSGTIPSPSTSSATKTDVPVKRTGKIIRYYTIY